MRKLALAFAATTLLAFAAPASASQATAPRHDELAMTQTDVSAQRVVIERRGPGFRRGLGFRRGFYRRPGRVVSKTVIRRGPMGRTVIRRTFR